MTSDSLYLRDMDVYTLSRGYGSNFGLLRTANSDFGLQKSFKNSYLLLDGMLGEYTVEMAIGGIQIIPMTNRPQGACGGFSRSLQKLSLCGRYRSDLRGEARSVLIWRIYRPQ